MSSHPLVSVVITFFNAEQFLAEAIESVLAQTYPSWELLLIDDGSTDGSRAIANDYSERRPQQIFTLNHPESQNRGMAASRNLGIQHSAGEYVAFLDADDIWLGHKLKNQVALLQKHQDVAMVYGRTQYWYSWTGRPQDIRRDFYPALRVPLNTPIRPPRLMGSYLSGSAAVPCTCSVIVRRSALESLGGFDESFAAVKSIYEDQAFYAKICLNEPVLASPSCWDLYRQHPKSSMTAAQQTGLELVAREYFLHWVEAYLQQHGIHDDTVWQALRREQWRLSHPTFLPDHRQVRIGVRWLKKWMMRLEKRVLPAAVSQRLWGGPG